MAGWNIPIFNRKYIVNPGPFSIAMLVCQSVTYIIMGILAAPPEAAPPQEIAGLIKGLLRETIG